MAFTEIDGVVRSNAEITLPESREFRGAWVLSGDVVTIDMDKAREIKAEKIMRKALDRVKIAEEQSLKKAIKGEDSTAEEDEIAKFKIKPKASSVALLSNATTPEELSLITEEDLF